MAVHKPVILYLSPRFALSDIVWASCLSAAILGTPTARLMLTKLLWWQMIPDNAAGVEDHGRGRTYRSMDSCDADTASYMGFEKEEVLYPVFLSLFHLLPLSHSHRHAHYLDHSIPLCTLGGVIRNTRSLSA
jgi:hypothetical protein